MSDHHIRSDDAMCEDVAAPAADPPAAAAMDRLIAVDHSDMGLIPVDPSDALEDTEASNEDAPDDRSEMLDVTNLSDDEEFFWCRRRVETTAMQRALQQLIDMGLITVTRCEMMRADEDASNGEASSDRSNMQDDTHLSSRINGDDENSTDPWHGSDPEAETQCVDSLVVEIEEGQGSDISPDVVQPVAPLRRCGLACFSEIDVDV